MGGDLGLGCRGDGFHGDGGWFERVVCPCLLHVELFNMSHDHSELLEGQSWDRAGQDGGHSSVASATKLFQCCLPNVASISQQIPILVM